MPTADPTEIRVPTGLLPADGRFGSGPSKVRPGAVAALARHGGDLLGTSHRQAPVRALVGAVRRGVADLLGLPDGWEVVLGNGGSSLFWDVASFGLVGEVSEHCVFGEFSAKFAAVVAAAPHLGDPRVVEAPPGTVADPVADPGVDTYALTHNETSTGAVATLTRPRGDGLVVVDATSAAGAIPFDPAQVDVYYFAPQKVLASDGGLWIAACSPAAVARVADIAASGRWVPASLDLALALAQSRLGQTLNTPAIATLVLLADQLAWLLEGGGLPAAAAHCGASASVLYGWAERRPWATPFVTDPALRSPVVGTVDLDPAVDHLRVCAALRANGVVDLEPYRKLGRNQLRVGMWPAVDTADVEALTACVDFVVDALS